MIFNMAGGGGIAGSGSGAGLNFKIVGGITQPVSPSKNTIWVNTDIEIISWIFSATEPENPAEGMAWFSIATASTTKFNALKKNGIMVYPLSAKQYIGGAWATVTAMTYQGEQWVDWVLYLYNKGEQYIDENGNGWVASGDYYTDGETYLLAGRTSSAGAYTGTWTSGLFDATNLNTVEVYVDKYSRGGPESFGKILILDEAGNTLVTKSYSASQTEIWESLDISTITSKCKVQVTSGHTRTSGQMAYIQFSIVRCH